MSTSVVAEIVDAIVKGVLSELKRKTGKRRRRRTRTLTPTERLRRIEKLLKPAAPARKKTSRRKSTSSRSKAHRSRVRTRTARRKSTVRRTRR